MPPRLSPTLGGQFNPGAVHAERSKPRRVGAESEPPDAELDEIRSQLTTARDDESEASDWLEVFFDASTRLLRGELEEGTLVAKAFTSELLLPETEVRIPKEQWSFLEIDLDNDVARGRQLQYFYLRIGKPV
jgi:hypothetical protein